jgi:hypothetical protein
VLAAFGLAEPSDMIAAVAIVGLIFVCLGIGAATAARN